MPVSAFACDVLQLLTVVEWQLDVISFPGRGMQLLAQMGRGSQLLWFSNDGDFWLFLYWVFL